MKKEKNTFKKNIVKRSYKIVSILTAFISASMLWYHNISPYWEEEYTGYGTLFAVGVLFCIIYWVFAKMYQAQKIGIYRLTELTYFQLLAFTIADVILIVESVIWFHGFAKLRILSFVFGFGVQMFVTVLSIFVHNRLFARYDEARKVMIIYGNAEYASLVKKMKAKKYRYNILGCYSDTTPMEELQAMIDQCESVYLYEADEEVKRQLIFYCDHIERDIYLTQQVDELLTMGFDISHTFDTPFIRTKRMPERWYYSFVKRTLDFLFAFAGLVLFSPIFLITALCIKLYDGGPIFYKQVRLTKGHREFQIYKFRSMIINAETDSARLATQNDARITPIGKVIRATRMDELPQLLNVLKGDMSLVGPRPERPEIEALYLEEQPEFGLRLKVKAGLTGYAQVFGKYNTTPEDKLKLDLLYINQRSLLLDIKLIVYTIKILFIPEATEGISGNKKTAGRQ
ncbi:MAG: exopolysaccharide biosynthesis polyprenyl glycosylphosphotransferase [Faecalimonas sp.]|nr:exopolysaccharide biosynthesis polyprenyl glycosylphosphotransferase [Faecalimonas sp.]